MAEKQKSSKQGRSRKSAQNIRYINEGRHNKSHVRRIAQHLARHPRDHAAAQMLRQYQIRAGTITARP